MNLEQLISKYLDGELSLAEDRELRDIITRDTEAKNSFEEAVELHYLLKQDAASVKVPLDVSSSTEDVILMRILSDIPKIDNVVNETKKNRSLLSAILPVFLLFIFVGLYKTDDLFITPSKAPALAKSEQAKFKQDNLNTNANLIKNDIKESTVYLNLSDENNSIKLIEKPITEFAIISSNNSNDLNLSSLELDKKITNDFVLINDIQEDVENVKTETKSELYFANSNPSTINANMNFPTYQAQTISRTGPSGTPAMMMNYSSGFETNKLNFTSLANTDVVRGGFNPEVNTLISTISQSVSYELKNNTYAGMEFGFSEYTFLKDRTVIISYDQLDEIHADMEGDRTKYGFRTNVKSNHLDQFYFASFYLGKNFLEYNRFSFDGRLGLGASNYGPLAFGKLFLKVNLFSGIDLVSGVDARVFNWNLSNYSNHSEGLRSSLSFVYGLNINL